MGVRLLVSASITPPRALDGRNTNYFASRTAEKVNKVMATERVETVKRIQLRLETEEFGAGKFPHLGGPEHMGRAAGKIQALAPRLQTTVKGKEKGTALKIYLSNPSMPWPLLTDWPIGVVGSHFQGTPFIIRPRKDRAATGHTRTASGRKSRRKRLYFFWKNAGVQFWGKQVTHPGFRRDVLTEELNALKERLPGEARAAVYSSVAEWTKGGSHGTTTRTNIRRR